MTTQGINLNSMAINKQMLNDLEQVKSKNSLSPDDQESSDDDDDDSCDFLSDNLSENAVHGRGPNIPSKYFGLQKKVQRKEVHLFVFVHGFQASSSDMRAIRNHL